MFKSSEYPILFQRWKHMRYQAWSEAWFVGQSARRKLKKTEDPTTLILSRPLFNIIRSGADSGVENSYFFVVAKISTVISQTKTAQIILGKKVKRSLGRRWTHYV